MTEDTTLEELRRQKELNKDLAWEASSAICAEDYFKVKALLDQGAEPNSAERGVPVLVQAAQRAIANVIALLIDSGADIDRPGDNGRTPLMAAARGENADALTELLKRGADVRRRDKEGQTALIHAATNRDPACLWLLLDNGADPNIKAKYGDTALLEAASSDNDRAAEMLVAKGADTGAKDQRGRTALELAEASDNEIMRRILQKPPGGFEELRPNLPTDARPPETSGPNKSRGGGVNAGIVIGIVVGVVVPLVFVLRSVFPEVGALLDSVNPFASNVTGHFESTNDELGKWTLAPDDCRSGQRQGFFGVVLQKEGDRDHWVMVERGAGEGLVVSTKIPGTNKTAKFSGCELTGSIERTNVSLNDVDGIDGSVKINCPDDGFRGEASFSNCF